MLSATAWSCTSLADALSGLYPEFKCHSDFMKDSQRIVLHRCFTGATLFGRVRQHCASDWCVCPPFCSSFPRNAPCDGGSLFVDGFAPILFTVQGFRIIFQSNACFHNLNLTPLHFSGFHSKTSSLYMPSIIRDLEAKREGVSTHIPPRTKH